MMMSAISRSGISGKCSSLRKYKFIQKYKSMSKVKSLAIIPDERIVGKIYFIRGQKVIFDRDLAVLYDVETRMLNQAVKRNVKRFPEDFMFQLNKQEADIFLRSQIVTSSEGDASRSQIVILKKGSNIKYFPYVFTEQGVAMLSSVLKSDRAIQVNIQIMRTFTKLREMLSTHKDLRNKIEKMEGKYDEQFKIVFKVLANFMKTDPKNRSGEIKIIGFTDRKSKK